MENPNKWIDVGDLEARFGVDRCTIYRWYCAKRFPSPQYLMGKRVWLISEIEAWERSSVVRTAPRRAIYEPASTT